MGLDSCVCHGPGQYTLDPELLKKFEELHLDPYKSQISFRSRHSDDFLKVATGYSMYSNLRPHALESMASSLDAVLHHAPDDDDAEIDAFSIPGNYGDTWWIEKPCVQEVRHIKWLRDIFRLCAENGLSLEASY
jgi:hypothetical protein